MLSLNNEVLIAQSDIMLEITNLTQNLIDKNFFEMIASYVLEKENKKGVISLVFVGPGRIKKLNKQYRKKNKVTDVLSFPENINFPFEEKPENFLGEIVICLRVVKKMARREEIPFNEAVARVFIHGILHLLGYDHEKDEEAEKIMLSKQESYLKEILKKINEKTNNSNN